MKKDDRKKYNEADPNQVRASSIMVGLVLILIAMLLLTSCGSGNPANYPIHTQTQAVLPTATSPLESLLSILPSGNPTLESVNYQSVVLETTLYQDPQDLYSLFAPKGWSASQGSNDLTFTAPQGDPRFLVSAVNTGYALDDASFARLIANEENKMSDEHEGLVEITRSISDEDHSVTIEKSLSEQGIWKRWVSYYRQMDQVIIKGDFIVNENEYDSYRDSIASLFSTIQVNDSNLAGLPLYAFDSASRHSNGHFSILLPWFWDFNRTEAENTVVETFQSPDKNAVIQTIAYDDGVPTSKSVAGDLTLSLLRDNYGTDITIKSDQLLGDGREKLTWTSTESGYQGQTSFSIQGNAVHILTVMWSDDQAEYYQPLLDQVFTSYQPEALP